MSNNKNPNTIYSNAYIDYIADFLDDDGGIMMSSIQKLINLMNDSHDKIVPKCLAITIISLSTDDVKIRLCDSGVWNILFQWLQDGLKNETTCFIIDILRLYLNLPISFENLTSNSCPKLIKKLTKNSDPDIISIAKDIVAKWKRIVEERTKDIPEVTLSKMKLDYDVKIDSVPEEKRKIRTVKVKNTDFRSSDVEEIEIDLTKVVKKIIPKSTNDKPGMEELHKKVSATVDKRKIIEIHESRNFMNSIMNTPAPPRKKKKRQEPFLNKSVSDIPLPDESVIENNSKGSPVLDTETLSDKSKKRVSWAPTDCLHDVKFFDLDENERVNVNKVSIEEMKKRERMIERQHASHKFRADIEDDSIIEKWYRPIAVAGLSDNKIEVTSVERTVQFERERKVLKVYYFAKDDIPLTPAEPDTEQYDVKEPINIPLEDIVTQKALAKQAAIIEANSKLLIYTEKEGSECHVALRPDVANLLKSMTQTPIVQPIQPPAAEPFTPEATQTRTKLINIIRSRHPDIDPEKLTSEEVCKLLEPLRDELIREGILSLPPPPSQNIPPPPPNFLPHPMPPWYSDPRLAYFPPRLPQDLHMMQRMPQMPFPPNRPMGVMPPPLPIRPFNQPQHMHSVCRFLLANGFCRLGNNCNFSHIMPEGGAPRQFNQNRN